MKQLFATIAYGIAFILTCLAAIPMIYGIFQFVGAFFVLIGDDMGLCDSWDVAFGS